MCGEGIRVEEDVSVLSDIIIHVQDDCDVTNIRQYNLFTKPNVREV